MIKKFSSVLMLLLAVFALSSCLSDDDEDKTTYYSDTAIKSFTLGTLNVSVHTKGLGGKDSVYTATFNGGSYKFTIDQLSRTITNLDSLPIGTDVKHVLVTITTENSGTPILNLRDKDGRDSLAYYSSKDSIDFTDPVRIRVYNMLASAYREYTVTLNVHKQRASSFSWNTTTTEALANVGNRKIVSAGDNMFLIGQQNNIPVFFRKDGNSWAQVTPNFNFTGEVYNNVAVKDGNIYILNGSQLLASSDCMTWSEVSRPSTITQLIGATKKYMYALAGNTIMRSNDNGVTWEADKMGDDGNNLPNADISFISRASKVNENVNNLVLIGNHDGKTAIWSKTEESDNDVEPWIYYNDDDYNTKTLPYLENLQVVSYGDNLLAMGGDFSLAYLSPDEGLTWDADTTYAMPETFGNTATQFTLAVDGNNVLYVSKAGSADILTGRLAMLGWKQNQTVFTRAARRASR